jgi:hypothetical protein
VDIVLEIAEAQFLTDQGDTVAAFRPYTAITFLGRHGQRIPIRAMIDSCAPFSVVPYQLWNTHGFAWSSISKTLTRRGKATGLDWHGIPCELGYAEIDLAGPRRLIAKFTLRPTQTADVILGANFVADNDLEFVLRGTGGALSGLLSVP